MALSIKTSTQATGAPSAPPSYIDTVADQQFITVMNGDDLTNKIFENATKTLNTRYTTEIKELKKSAESINNFYDITKIVLASTAGAILAVGLPIVIMAAVVAPMPLLITSGIIASFATSVLALGLTFCAHSIHSKINKNHQKSLTTQHNNNLDALSILQIKTTRALITALKSNVYPELKSDHFDWWKKHTWNVGCNGKYSPSELEQYYLFEGYSLNEDQKKQLQVIYSLLRNRCINRCYKVEFDSKWPSAHYSQKLTPAELVAYEELLKIEKQVDREYSAGSLAKTREELAVKIV